MNPTKDSLDTHDNTEEGTAPPKPPLVALQDWYANKTAPKKRINGTEGDIATAENLQDNTHAEKARLRFAEVLNLTSTSGSAIEGLHPSENDKKIITAALAAMIQNGCGYYKLTPEAQKPVISLILKADAEAKNINWNTPL